MGISPVRLLSFAENLPSTFVEFKKKSDQYVYLEQDSYLIWENFLPVLLLGPVQQFGSQEYKILTGAHLILYIFRQWSKTGRTGFS